MSRKKRMVLAIALFCAFVISSFGLVFAHVLDDFNLLGMFGITAVLDDKSEGGEETGFLLQSGQAETDPTVPEEEPGEHEETGDVEETGEPDEPGETEEIEEIKEIEEPGEPEDTSEPGEPVTAPAGEEPVDTDGSSEAVINSGTLSAASAASNWYVSGFTLPEVSWSGIGSGLGAVKSVEQVDSRQIMVIWLHDGEELRFPTYCLDSQTDFNDSPDYTESGISVDDCRIIFILNYSFPILTPAQITQLWGLENTISAAAAYEAAQYAVSTFTNPTHTLAPLSGIGEVLAQRLIAAAQAACEHGTPCEGYVYLPDERTALEIKFAEPLSGAVNKDSSTAGKYVFGPYKVISPGYEYANAAVDIDINGDGIAPEDWKIFDAAGIPLKHAYLNEDFYIHFSPPPKGNFALTAVLTDFEKINYLHLAKRMIDIDNLDHAENQEILYYEYGSDSPLPAAAEVLFENEETIIIDVLKEQLQGSDDLNGESFGIGVFILDDSLENVIAVKNKEELYAGGGTSISLTDFSSYVGSNYMIFIGELWENFEKELRGGYLVTQETEIYIDGVRTIDIKNIEADGENYIGYALKLDEMPFMLEIKFGNRRKTDEIFRLPTLEIEKSYVDLTGAPETEFKFSIFWLNEAAYEFIGEFSIEAEPLGNGGFDGKYAGNILDMIAAYWEASNRQDSYFDKTFLITEENYPNGYTADNEILRETDVTSGGQSGVKFYQYHAGRPLLPAAPNWSGTHRYPGIEFKLPQPAAAEEPDKLTILFKNTSSLTERSLDIKLSKTYINGKKETPFEFYLYRARNDEWYFIKEFSVIPNVYNDINIYDIIRADALEEGYNYLEFEYILIENWEIKPSTYMSPGNGSTEISAPEHGYFTLRDGSPNFIGVEERSGLFGEFDSITRSFHIDTNGRYASFKPEPDASGRILKAEESAPYYPGISLTLNSDEMFSAYEVSLNINFKNKDPETPRLDPEIAVEKSWVDLYGNPETPASGFGMFIAVIDENDTVIARNPLDLGRLDSIIEQIKELINGTSGISDYRGERFVIYENYPQRSEVPISSTVITLEDAEGFLPASDIRSGYISFPAGGDISGITAGYALNFIITEPGNTAPDGALPAVAFSFPNDPLKDYTDPPKIKILFINTGDRRYSLEVHKLGAKGGETLAGAVFELYNYRADWVYEDYSAAVPLGTLDMTESGSLIVRNLPPGDYVLIEILAPQGYKQPEDDGIIIVVRLGEDGATTYIRNFLDETRTWVSIIKVDAEEKSPLDGARFILEARKQDENGSYIWEWEERGELQPSENGVFSFRLNAGHYRIKEIQAPAGYVLNESVYYYFEISGGSVLNFRAADAEGNLKHEGVLNGSGAYIILNEKSKPEKTTTNKDKEYTPGGIVGYDISFKLPADIERYSSLRIEDEIVSTPQYLSPVRSENGNILYRLKIGGIEITVPENNIIVTDTKINFIVDNISSYAGGADVVLTLWFDASESAAGVIENIARVFYTRFTDDTEEPWGEDEETVKPKKPAAEIVLYKITNTDNTTRTFNFVLQELNSPDAHDIKPDGTLMNITGSKGTFRVTVPDLSVGEYYYKISESPGGESGWTYDLTVYIVKVSVTVTENTQNSQLTARAVITYLNGKGEVIPAGGGTFTNIYKPENERPPAETTPPPVTAPVTSQEQGGTTTGGGGTPAATTVPEAGGTTVPGGIEETQPSGEVTGTEPDRTTAPGDGGETQTITEPEAPPPVTTIIDLGDDLYLIVDEDGIPTGYIQLEEGEDIDDIEDFGDLIPLGDLPFTEDKGERRPNPITGNVLIFGLIILVLIAAAAGIIIIRKQRQQQ